MTVESERVCIGIVLSAGGLRGAAHLGVLRAIARQRIPVEVMVGVSAGAIIAAFHAAVGLSVREMIEEAPVFRGRHILIHGLGIRAPRPLKPIFRWFSGVIPRRLEQLDAASFDTLHHGVRRLGIVCHDITEKRPRYFSTANSSGVRLADVARASAAVPGVLPPKRVTLGAHQVSLADGGLSDSLPVAFARSPQMGATHVIVSDCRYSAPPPPSADESLVYIRPNLEGIRPFRAPRAALLQAVWRGEAAVTPDLVERMRAWVRVQVSNEAPALHA
jgi:NTE family protein